MPIIQIESKIKSQKTGITPQLKMTVNLLEWEVSLKAPPANKMSVYKLKQQNLSLLECFSIVLSRILWMLCPNDRKQYHKGHKQTGYKTQYAVSAFTFFILWPITPVDSINTSSGFTFNSCNYEHLQQILSTNSF